MPPVRTQPGYDTEQIENDLSAVRGAHDALNEYAEFTTAVVAGVVVAQQPGTTNSLESNGTPMTQETWHSFAPLSSSWSVPAGGWAMYRITTSNELQISAHIQSPSSSINGQTIATFPVGYRPASAHAIPVAADVANNTAGANSVYVSVGSTGNLQAQGVGALANVFIDGRIPLDL